MVEYKSLSVTCPICQTGKDLNVPEAIFTRKKFGTIKIQVPPGAVCPEHQFIVFVDTKGIIRGYERIDIHMCAPTAAEEEGKITIRTFVQMLGPEGLASLIHAKTFFYPAYIQIGPKYEGISKELINQIGESILPKKYRGGNTVHYIDDLSKFKLKEKEALVIDSQQYILKTPWEEKLKFEQGSISKALEIIDDREQLIILQQDIAKLVKEAEYVKKSLKNIKEIYEDDLIEQISRDLMIPKINHYRLTLIKDFIRRRYDPKLAKKIKNKVEDFLSLL
jgi:hypothetical protein